MSACSFFGGAKRAFGNPLPGSRRFLSSLDRPLIAPFSNPARSSPLPAPQTPERLPATFGLILWSGFEEMLLKGARLPARKEITLYGIFDYIRTSEIQVVYRHSLLHTHTEIAPVNLRNICQALAKDTFRGPVALLSRWAVSVVVLSEEAKTVGCIDICVLSFLRKRATSLS